MRVTRYTLEMLFGIGFKIGFLITIVGVLMMYMPMIVMTVDPILGLIGFWQAFRENPEWFKVVSTGLILMVVAVLVNMIKGWFEPLVDTLFYEDKVSQIK